jgi:ferrochelatase
LARRGHGELPIALGFKHAPPFIETAVAQLVAERVERIVGIVLAPHFSALSIGEYAARARGAAAREEQPPEVTVVNDWHLAPPYLELLATNVAEALAALPAAARDGAHVLFTAHSLPARILEMDDPYPTQLRETAAAVAELAGLERWDIAWQSAGRTPEPWIGPDVLDVLEQLAGAGASAVVVCPAGFVADHLEVLYDLDIAARDRAARLGLPFVRTASPNAAPQLVEAVTDAVLAELAVVTL